MPRRSRLARLLRAYCLGQLLVALAWLVWRWPIAPAQAAGGALLVLAIGPLGLAVEFAMLAFVARAHPGVPLPSTAQLLRAWASESVHLVRVFSWRQPFRWRAVPSVSLMCLNRSQSRKSTAMRRPYRRGAGARLHVQQGILGAVDAAVARARRCLCSGQPGAGVRAPGRVRRRHR